MVRSDNGTEFMCSSGHFRELVIIHQTSCVSTPQQNGRVERKHILNVARALLFQASLPIDFWGEAILTAAYLINRTPSKLHNGLSPYEILHHHKPDYSQMKVFGSACYVHKASRTKDKFDSRSLICVFLGYALGKKGWKVYDLDRKKIFISHDVVFREDVFPFADKVDTLPSSLPSSASQPDADWIINTPVDNRGSSGETNLGEPAISPPPEPTTLPSAEPAQTDSTGGVSNPDTTTDMPLPTTTATTDTSLASSSDTVRRGQRDRAPSVKLKDYVTYNAMADITPHAPPSSSESPLKVSGTTPYPLSEFISDANFSPGHQAFLAAITAGVEPKNFIEAMQDDVWKASMFDEVGALEEQHIWDITDLPPGKVAISNQWIYRIKYNADGTIKRCKSRLVVNGNKQIEGED